MAIIASSISVSAVAKERKHHWHANDKSCFQNFTRNLPNQSKRRSKVAGRSTIHRKPSDAMIDVLSALEGLDMSISGTASLTSDRKSYLTSPTLTYRWQVALHAQLNEFLGGKVSAEVFEGRMQVILLDVERLEKTRDLMQSGGNDVRVLGAVNERCRKMEQIFETMEKQLDLSNMTV